MAKTIKFTLICDGFPARTIEDLQDHFVVAEMLDYYRNGILRRWLEVRGYLQQADAVSKITCTEPKDIVDRIFDIFQIDHREVLMQKYTDTIKKQEEARKLEAARLEAERLAAEQKKREEQEKQRQQSETNVTMRPASVLNLMSGIDKILAGGIVKYSATAPNNSIPIEYKKAEVRLLNGLNIAANAKECIAVMVEKYPAVFAEHHQELFDKLWGKSLLALLCLLMNPKSRPYFCPYDINGNSTHDDEKYPLRNDMHTKICSMYKDPNHLRSLGYYLKNRSDFTNSKYTVIEPAGRKCMVLSIGAEYFQNMTGTLRLADYGENSAYRDRVRPAGNTYKEYDGGDVMNRFMIFDGIQYIHWTTRNTALLYLEV